MLATWYKVAENKKELRKKQGIGGRTALEQARVREDEDEQ